MRKTGYTCSTLLCLDRILYRAKGKNCYWNRDKDGFEAVVIESKHGIKCEVYTHFPDWCFYAAAWLQNRFPWTRKFLSL
jgi:hypothetical protein